MQGNTTIGDEDKTVIKKDTESGVRNATRNANDSVLSNHELDNTVLGNTVQGNTVQSNTVQSNTVQSNTVLSNTVQSNTVQSNTVQSNTVQSNTVLSSTVQSNTELSNTELSNTAPSITAPSNTAPSNTEQNNTEQNNTVESKPETSNTEPVTAERRMTTEVNCGEFQHTEEIQRHWVPDGSCGLQGSSTALTPTQSKTLNSRRRDCWCRMGEEALQIFSSTLESAAKTETVQEVMAKMTAHFQPASSIHVERVKLSLAIRNEGESIDDYTMRLRQVAKHCGY